MKFTKRMIVTAIAAAVVILGGCNDGAKQPSANPAAASSSSSATATQSPQPTKLPDPRSLKGISAVTGLSDPVPVNVNTPATLPVTVKDVEGTPVTVKDTSRILALDIYGTLSRTVIALGLGKNIVGLTVSSTETMLKDLPVVTQNGHSLNAESVLSLKPTVIIADRSIGPPEAFAQIRAAGVPIVFVSQDRSLKGNSELMMSIAHALGVDQAGKALVKRTEKEVAAARTQIKKWAPKDPLRVAFLYVRGTSGVFFILGGEYGVHALIEGVSGRDLAQEQGIKSMAPANAEALVKLNPEVFFMMTDGLKSTGGYEGLVKRPGVKDTIAGSKPRIVTIPDGLALSFGPQTGEVLLKVARALYGVPNGAAAK